MLLRPQRALAGAIAGAGLLFLVWLLVFHVGPVQRADASILRGFADLSIHSTIVRVARPVAQLCDPKPYVVLVAIPLVVALVRRRFRLAVAMAAILLGANVTTELLKPLLAAPRPAWVPLPTLPIGPASWPSGHATAAMSWALCMVLAVPRRHRPAAATIGAALTVAVTYSFLVLGWHYPSDVLGGYLVAATWTLLGVAALRATEIPLRRRTSTRTREHDGDLPLRQALTPPAAALAFAVLLAAVLAIARPHAVVSYAHDHGAFMVGAAGIGLLALALATGMMLALRR